MSSKLIYIILSYQIKSKKNLYSAVYSTDSEALGGRIRWGRRNDTDKFLSVFWKWVQCQQHRPADCSTEKVQRRRTLAWQVQCAFSARSGAACRKVGASVTGCDRSAANLGTAVITSDEPWTSGWRLCVWCARGLAASVTTAEAWHWPCCCSASQYGFKVSAFFSETQCRSIVT